MSHEYHLHRAPSVNIPRIDYAQELNEQQHAAVTAPPGPSLVIAGAGSGKTRTLTFRVAYLLEQGVPADRILLLTFTNKAAHEMMRRVAELIGQERPELWGGTFHSIGARILRGDAERMGYSRGFTILDREDSEALIKNCVAESKPPIDKKHFPKNGVLAGIFSKAVNTNCSCAEVVSNEFDYIAEHTEQIERIAQAYIERKKADNVMDFDDLLTLWLKLMREHPEVREHYQRKFQYVLVDEYQDTNIIQSDLIDLLAAQHKNVMVVGDDAQSIYGWRGANFKNILLFPKRYPDAQVYKIEVNYRSTPQILATANAAIAANEHQFQKELRPVQAEGPKPAIVPCGDGYEQAAFICQRVKELHEDGASLNSMAVLYRSHFHAMELQLELTRQGIPFSITSGIRFFEQAHIKDVSAYIKLVCNPTDEMSFNRIVLMLPGVGEKGASKLWRIVTAHKSSLPLDTAAPLSAALHACADAIPAKAKSDWPQFIDLMETLESDPIRSSPSQMIETILKSSYQKYLQETFENYRIRLEDLDQLAAFANGFTDTEEFLTQLSLLTNVEAEDDRKVADDADRLHLSTIHQAKGLEFDVVFVIMLCERLFPSAFAVESEDGIEEERRLFYVAVTRARKQLFLSYPLMRMSRSYEEDATQTVSRFLMEIPSDLIEPWNLHPF